jgi:hypothetical protein
MCPVPRLEKKLFLGCRPKKKLNRILWTLKVSFHESTLEELLMFTAIQEVDW